MLIHNTNVKNYGPSTVLSFFYTVLARIITNRIIATSAGKVIKYDSERVAGTATQSVHY